MIHVYLIILTLINIFWLVLVFVALPGNWLIVTTTCLFAWWKWDDGLFSIYTLIAITTLALIGEIIEFFAGPGGARKAGASFRGAFGAIIGTIAGAIAGTILIPLPLLGTLLGACIGAGLGALAMELTTGKPMPHSLRSGIGASVGTLIGTTSKLAIGVIIWLIVTIASFHS